MVRLLAALALCLQLSSRVTADPELDEAETQAVASYRAFRVPTSLDGKLFYLHLSVSLLLVGTYMRVCLEHPPSRSIYFCNMHNYCSVPLSIYWLYIANA